MLTERIHYHPSDLVVLTGTNAPFTVKWGLNESMVCGNFQPPEPGGYQVTDSAGNSSVFTVADNVFDVGVGGNWGADQQTNFGGHGKWQNIPQKCVAAGVNLFELFFAAPCDFSQLVGNGAWLSGQTRYAESDAGIKGLVQACHKVGVKAGLYVNRWPSGPAGYALTQSHPEFFLKDGFGNIDSAPPDLPSYDWSKWNDPKYTPADPIWRPFTLDLSNSNVIQYGIDQIKAAVLVYGFDFVRFDGHYTVPGNANLSIRNMLMVREQLVGKCLVGFNFGKGGDINSEGAVALAGGMAYVEEKGATAAQRNAVMGMGGSYYTIQPGDPFAHPWYTLTVGTTPAQSAFARRWFPKFIWNRDLSLVAPGVKCLVEGSKRYYVTELLPGRYTLGRLTNVVTPENGLEKNVGTAVVATVGLVIDEYAPVDPIGVIRCPARRDVSGVAAQIGGDGRQYRPDLSTGVNPFMGVTVGPFAAGTYRVAYRLWLEAGASGAFAFQVQPPGGQPLLKQSLNLPTGAMYQDIFVGQVVVPDGAMLNAVCWPANGNGAVHLDSVSFTPI